MEKLLYPIWRAGDRPVADLADALLDGAAPSLLALPLAGVTVHVEDPAGSPMRMGRAGQDDVLAGLVSVWIDSVDHHPEVDAIVARVADRWAGYVVTESVPIDYDDRQWPDGERSPGISQVTVFDKRPDIDIDQFLARWHGSHTPLTFEIHPARNYVRHVVARSLGAGAPALGAVVHETFDLEDLLDPMRFYRGDGSEARMRDNMQRMSSDLESFVDFATLETNPMAEYLLRTFPPLDTPRHPSPLVPPL